MKKTFLILLAFVFNNIETGPMSEREIKQYNWEKSELIRVLNKELSDIKSIKEHLIKENFDSQLDPCLVYENILKQIINFIEKANFNSAHKLLRWVCKKFKISHLSEVQKLLYSRMIQHYNSLHFIIERLDHYIKNVKGLPEADLSLIKNTLNQARTFIINNEFKRAYHLLQYLARFFELGLRWILEDLEDAIASKAYDKTNLNLYYIINTNYF